MNNQQPEIKLPDFIQAAANKHQKKVYVYLLENGNRFSSFDIMPRSQLIGGSKIKQLLDIIEPEKK